MGRAGIPSIQPPSLQAALLLTKCVLSSVISTPGSWPHCSDLHGTQPLAPFRTTAVAPQAFPLTAKHAQVSWLSLPPSAPWTVVTRHGRSWDLEGGGAGAPGAGLSLEAQSAKQVTREGGRARRSRQGGTCGDTRSSGESESRAGFWVSELPASEVRKGCPRSPGSESGGQTHPPGVGEKAEKPSRFTLGSRLVCWNQGVWTKENMDTQTCPLRLYLAMTGCPRLQGWAWLRPPRGRSGCAPAGGRDADMGAGGGAPAAEPAAPPRL